MGEYIKKKLQVKRFLCLSLVCMLFPVHYREFEYGLLKPGIYYQSKPSEHVIHGKVRVTILRVG